MGEQRRENKPFIRVKSRSGTEHVHYSAVYEGFPEEFQAVAAKELKETPEARKKGLKRLKEYMKSQGVPPLKDDLPLLAALRNCKYNVTKAEPKLKKLMSVRRDLAVRLRTLGMQTIEQIVNDMPFGMLPFRDKLGRVIIFTRPSAARLDLYTFSDVAVVAHSMIVFQLSFPITSVSGYAYFGDCTSPSLHLYYSIFKEIRTSIDMVFSLPIKMARMEILNENSMCKWFVNVVKMILSKKIADRINMHGTNFEHLHEMYSPGMLPEEFGGTAGSLSCTAYKEKFLDFVRHLLDEEF